MKHLFWRWALAAALLLGLGAAPAHAGRSCEAKKPSTQSIERGLALAERTAAALEAEYAKSGAQVVVLARAGQDLREYGLRWSHLGFALRQSVVIDGKPTPVWRVLHKLNQCGAATASLYRQGLGEFFLDDPWRYETAWAVPTPEVQARLQAVLTNPARMAALHQRSYSLVAYPWAQKYQQSNQWALETLALAMQPGAAPPTLMESRLTAQNWLRANGYQPSTLHISALKRLGGRLSAANVAFDDHPDSKRFDGRIETVTVDSVFAWLPRAGLASGPLQ
jgi:hypothetical protein